MLDNDLLRQHLEPSELQSLADAALILHKLGVFPLQAKSNSMLIAERINSQEDPETVTREILQVRQTNRTLLALHEWAGKFKEDLINAPA